MTAGSTGSRQKETRRREGNKTDTKLPGQADRRIQKETRRIHKQTYTKRPGQADRRRQEGDKNRHRHETAVPGKREEAEGDKKETKTDADTKRPCQVDRKRQKESCILRETERADHLAAHKLHSEMIDEDMTSSLELDALAFRIIQIVREAGKDLPGSIIE